MWQNCIEQFHILGIMFFFWKTVIVFFTSKLKLPFKYPIFNVIISKHIPIFDFHWFSSTGDPLNCFIVSHSHYCVLADALKTNVNECLHPADTMQRQVVGSKRYVYCLLFLSFYGHDVHEIVICYGHNICPCQVQFL